LSNKSNTKKLPSNKAELKAAAGTKIKKGGGKADEKIIEAEAKIVSTSKADEPFEESDDVKLNAYKYAEPEADIDEETPGDDDLIEIIAKAPLPVKKGVPRSDLVHLDPLQRYLMEIRVHKLLDRDEEYDLAVNWKETQNIDAAHRLVQANLRLVVKIALEYRRYWMNLLDLIQEGNVGLMQAVKNYDPYKNVKLSSYASFWIKAYILKFIIDNWSLVKIGTTQAQRKLFFNLRKEQERLAKLGIEATAKEIASSLNVSEDDVSEMTQRLGYSGEVSLDAPLTSDGEDTHMDFLADKSPAIDDKLAENELQQIFHDKLIEFRKTLKDKDLYLFDNRLLSENPRTLQEIGDEFKVTRERIRQIEMRLMTRLKEFVMKEIPELKQFDISPSAAD